MNYIPRIERDEEGIAQVDLVEIEEIEEIEEGADDDYEPIEHDGDPYGGGGYLTPSPFEDYGGYDTPMGDYYGGE